MLASGPTRGISTIPAAEQGGVTEVSCGDLPDPGCTAKPEALSASSAGRQAILGPIRWGLRSSTVVTNDLARAISMLGEELTADQTLRYLTFVCRWKVNQGITPAHPGRRPRIASEALRAFRHALRGGSKWKSVMTNGSFSYRFGTMEKALIRRFWVGGLPDTPSPGMQERQTGGG